MKRMERMMQGMLLKPFILLLTLFLFSGTGYANTTQDQITFNKLFSAWTLAFNQKKHHEVCQLFSKSLTSDYQGAPHKHYTKLCDDLKKILSDNELRYHNRFKIHQIYRSNDLAAVRITWYLDVYKNGKHLSTTQEEGLDILNKEANGKWQIVNFLAYPVKNNA